MCSGGTLTERCLSTVRRRRTGYGVAGRDCSFDDFGSTWAETVTDQEKGSRSGHVQARRRTQEIESRQRKKAPWMAVRRGPRGLSSSTRFDPQEWEQGTGNGERGTGA